MNPETQQSNAAAPLGGLTAHPRRWTLHGLNNSIIFKATVEGVRRFPRGLSYGIGSAGSWLAWQLMARSNEAIAENLRAVLPYATDAELQRRALDTYRSYARDTIDFLRALFAQPEDSVDLFEIPPAHLKCFTDLRAEGRGMLLVTAHYGNWEIGSILIRRVLNFPFAVLSMPEASAGVNRMRTELRVRLGVETIEVRQSLDTALQIRRRLAANEVVALLIDRHLGRDRVSVRFFGRDTWFLRTPALLGYLAGAPLVPGFLERVGPGRFRTVVGEPIRVDTKSSRDEAIQQATQRVADVLEQRIREHPQFWYQFYRYWDAQRDDYAGLA